MKLEAGDAVPDQYLNWFKADLRHAKEWREQAKLDYEFRDNHQWSDDDRLKLEEQGRMPVTFNRIQAIVDAVSGQEISNRQEVRYIPRVNGPPEAGGDTAITDLYTSASRWFRDRADADDNDSEAFRDTITGGMGWTETRLDYEDNPEGDLKDDRIDPFEMVWDCAARKLNLIDANRVWRVRKVPLDVALSFAEGLGIDSPTGEDLNAEWALDATNDSASPHVSESVRDRTRSTRGPDGQLTEIVIVHCQWVERETVWNIRIPGQASKPMTDAEYKQFLAGAPDPESKAMAEKAAVKQKRKVRYQAILGAKVLKVMPTACPQHFNFKCITGKRDQVKGQFYGLVRAMRDPQAWSNKLFSQILHIINSQAKGGILAEHGAFENAKDAEESWARSDRITWMKGGSMSSANPKWAQKPVAQVPAGLQYLMEVSGTALHQVSGVNLELLGQREATQAGVLEYQRRQAGLTILQPYFDALKAYRREQGELILWYIQHDLSDGRLVRIVGKQEGEYVPLRQDPEQGSLEYDIIVDDAPTSPNQKEKNWQLITQMLPFIKDFMTPEAMLALAEDSPLQSATIQKLTKLNQQASQGPMAEMKQKMAMLEAAVLETKAALQAAQAEKAKADAQATMIEAQQPPEPPGAAAAIKAQETQGKLALKAAEGQANLALKTRETEANMALAQQKQADDIDLKREAQAQQQAMQQSDAEHAMSLRTAETLAGIANADRAAEAAAQRKPPAR